MPVASSAMTLCSVKIPSKLKMKAGNYMALLLFSCCSLKFRFMIQLSRRGNVLLCFNGTGDTQAP